MLHVTDKRNHKPISIDGLLAGGSLDNWMGRGTYWHILERIDQFYDLLNYSKRFLKSKPGYSGEIIVVIRALEKAKILFVQADAVKGAMQTFRKTLIEKCTSEEIDLPRNPANGVSKRPLSFLIYEVWKALVRRELYYKYGVEANDALNWISCQYPEKSNLDLPFIPPPEICVSQDENAELAFIGSPEQAYDFLCQNKHFVSNRFENNAQLESRVVWATMNVTSRIEKMEKRDLIYKLDMAGRQSAVRTTTPNFAPTEILQETLKPGNDALRIADLIRARHMTESVLLHDMQIIVSDFQRRLRTKQTPSLFDRGHLFEKGEISNSPPKAASTVIERYGMRCDGRIFESIYKSLPIEGRALSGIQGTAYYVPRGELVSNALLITKKGVLYQNAKPTELAFDRAHELGHFIYQEFSIAASDEEDWCDAFADTFVTIEAQFRRDAHLSARAHG